MNSKDPWILLIDDDKEFSKILETYLKRLNVQLVSTSTIEEFAAVVKAELPTVCLVDLNLNGLVAGYSLIKGLRKKYGVNFPMMIISATNDVASIAHAIECGADDYITKPVNLQDLNAKLEKYIKVAKAAPIETTYTDAPSGGEEATIGFEVRVKIIDELMVQVICPHFLPKGAPANCFGEIIDQAFPGKKRALGSVSNCELMPDGAYLISLEFIEMLEPEKSSLRKFVSQKK